MGGIPVILTTKVPALDLDIRDAQACEAVEQLPNDRLSIELLIGPVGTLDLAGIEEPRSLMICSVVRKHSAQLSNAVTEIDPGIV